mgnify:FL=1
MRNPGLIRPLFLLLLLLATLAGCDTNAAMSDGAMPADAAASIDGASDLAVPAPADMSRPPPGECDHTAYTEAALFARVKQQITEIIAGRAAAWNALYGLDRNGQKLPGSLTSVTWDPSHDSVWFDSTDPGRNVPALISNVSAKSPPSQNLILGMAGDTGAARYFVFGANPMHDLARTNEPGGSANADMGRFIENTITWLAGRDLKQGPSKIVVAHITDTYWFRHDRTTLKWVKNAYPMAAVNTEDACESADLAGCLAGADLLVIGLDDGTMDDNDKTPYDGAAALAAVTAAQSRGLPVLYVQSDGGLTDLGRHLMTYFRLRATDNYFRQEGLSAVDGSKAYPARSELDPLATLATTLESHTLTGSAYSACIDQVATLTSCATPEFVEKVRAGSDWLRTSLAALDGAAVPMCAAPGYSLLKSFLMLADKYRAGDGQTPAIGYPVDINGRVAVPIAYFADSTVHYTRADNPAQKTLGTFVCPRIPYQKGTCTGYDANAAPRGTLNVTNPLPATTEWTSTGAYLLPGRPITVTRTDKIAAAVEVRFNFHRVATTRSAETNRGISKYDRPQYLQSPAIPLAANQPLVLSSPYGGPIYLVLPGGPMLAGQSIAVTFDGVARHPTILDTGDNAQIAAFVKDIETNPLPHVDLRGDGFETHLRKDKLLDSVKATPGNINFPPAMAKLVDDYRYLFVEQVYRTAGFKVPARSLIMTLPGAVQAVCAAFGWTCTDEALNRRLTIQHSNYDEEAACGSGCSGNPWDASWNIDPLGWGESHELGHNLQMTRLNIHYVAAADRNNWKKWQNRAGENSNNMFPYHTLWNQQRNVLGNQAAVRDGHMNHKDLFAVIQSDLAGLTRTVNGQTRKVVFDHNCNRLYDYPANNTDNRYDAIWANGAYAADNGLRMSFYLQLPLMIAGTTLRDGTKIADGFDILTLLYDHARQFGAAAKDAATWMGKRDAIGFGAIPFDGDATYDGGNVGTIPGNDFLLISLSFLTGKDYRPYFDSRGVRYSDLAVAQVNAHIQAGRVKGAVSPDMYVLDDDLPGADLSGLPRVALDGAAVWPRDQWSPAKCP